MEKSSPTMKKQHGLTLMELLLVTIILLGIVTTMFVVYPRVVAAREAMSSAKMLSVAQAQIRAIFPNRLYGGLNNSMAGDADIFPEDMDLDYPNGKFMNNFGNGVDGNITIMGTNQLGVPATGNVARFATIVFGDVPTDVCLKLIPGLASNWERVTVEGVEAINKFDDDKTNDVADPVVVANQCNLNKSVTIAMTTR